MAAAPGWDGRMDCRAPCTLCALAEGRGIVRALHGRWEHYTTSACFLQGGREVFPAMRGGFSACGKEAKDNGRLPLMRVPLPNVGLFGLLSCGAQGSLAHLRMCKAFFPTRGKEPKGARGQRNRTSTSAAPGPLPAWLKGETSRCARLIASSRGRLGGVWVLYHSFAGGRAAPVGRPRCAQGGWARMKLVSMRWHGRRSKSNLCRPPQEVAASCPQGGARKHGRSGATAGESRPSSRNQKASPAGKVSRRQP